MNLFKKLWSTAKDSLKENAREKTIKAEYNTYIAQKKEAIAKQDVEIEKAITTDGYSFKSIVEKFEKIKFLEDEINLAKETYDHIFKDAENSTNKK